METGGEERYLVAFVDKLVCPGDKFKPINMIELVCNLVPEQPSSAARANGPRVDIFGIRPDQVTECALVGNLLCPSHNANLINCPDLRAETPVYTEKLAVNNRG